MHVLRIIYVSRIILKITNKTILIFSLVNQTAFSAQGLIACSISARAKRVWNTSYTFFVSAAHPHPGVLIDARGSLDRNSALNMVEDSVSSHTITLTRKLIKSENTWLVWLVGWRRPRLLYRAANNTQNSSSIFYTCM